jgi:uncharacterized ion transporter superfamily protein YfcC
MDDEQQRRAAAVRRVKAKRDFRTHIVVYVVVNAFLVAIWALSGGGYFWPIWSILGWGIGLVLNGWSAYFEKGPITEEEIRREMGKGDGSS